MSGVRLAASMILLSLFARAGTATPRQLNQELQAGTTLEREMRGGDSHSFEIRLRQEEFLQFVVNQRGVDVVVSVFDAAGERLKDVDGSTGRYGPELVYIIAADAGIHRIQVRPLQLQSGSGTYTLTVEAVRPATNADRALLASEGAWLSLSDGLNQSINAGDAESASDLFRQLLRQTEKFERRDTKYSLVAAYASSLADALAARDSAGAEAILNDTLGVMNRTQDPDSSLTARVMSNLGRFYMAQGKRDQAEPLLRTAARSVDRHTDVEPLDVAEILRNWGLFFLNLRSPGDAEGPLGRAVEIFSRELGSDHPLLLQTEFELGSAYLLFGYDLEKARPLIERAASEAGTRQLPTSALVDRLAGLAQLRLEQHAYPDVQRVVERVLAIDRATPIRMNQLESVLDSSAKAYLRAGEYAKAETAYREVLDIEKTKPAQDQVISGVLNFLAGLVLDQGRYKEADALYRQALQAVLDHPLIDPTTRDDICLNWASLRRDIGRTSEAAALEGWTRGTANSPPPFPAELVVPPLMQLSGLTPNQFRRRLREPYVNDLTAVWNELGVAAWETCNWPQCVEQNWNMDLAGGNTGVLERVHLANGINGPTRFLLFEPTDHQSNGVQEWRVYGILDLPYGDRQGTARIEKLGDKRWLVLEAGSVVGGSRSYLETWYDITEGKFQPVAGYPAGTGRLQSVVTELVGKLHSENWIEREEAVHRIAAIPDATKSTTVVRELVDLLDRENRLMRDLFKQGTGASSKYGEGFGEYVSYILDILMKSGDLRDKRTLAVLAHGSYNPDSRFAMNLADSGGAILVPIALELIRSDESFERWDALSLLGRLYEKRTTHQLPAVTVQTIKQTIVNAAGHSEITTRRWAVRVLGQIGTLDDVPLLQRIAATDRDNGPRFSVREEAVKAIETIRQKK